MRKRASSGDHETSAIILAPELHETNARHNLTSYGHRFKSDGHHIRDDVKEALQDGRVYSDDIEPRWFDSL